jgi:uncharacterized membrane protein YhfC
MTLLDVAYAVQVLFMVGFPIVLVLFLRYRWGLRWKLFWVGCLTFVVSQVVHIPMLIVEKLGLELLLTQLGIPVATAASVFWVVALDAVLLGLMAAICEEPARWLGYWLLLRKDRRWRESLMFGAGHGGIESILLGLLVVVNLVTIAWLANTNLASLGITGMTEVQVRQQIEGIVAAPLYIPFLGASERLWAICIHLSATVLVWRAITTRRWRYFLAAIGWHWLVDSGVVLVLAVTNSNLFVTEAAVWVCGLLSLGFVWWSRRWAKEETPPDAGAVPEALETSAA